MLIANDLLDAILRAIVVSSVAVCWIVILVRFIGLRAFSKITAFDFVVTVATGSLLAGASHSTTWSGFLQAAVGMASLLGVILETTGDISVLHGDRLQERLLDGVTRIE